MFRLHATVFRFLPSAFCLLLSGFRLLASELVTLFLASQPKSGNRKSGIWQLISLHLSLATALLLSAFCFLPSAGLAQTVSDTRPQLAPAPIHPGTWWPNRGSEPRNAYTGPQACASCHPSIVESWQKTQMAHALEPAADSQYLRANPDMTFQHGPYTYRVVREGSQSIYSVTDGSHTLSIPLLWAYGVGVVGQAFVFRINGIYYESEAAYYPVLHRLSIVAGLPNSVPATLQEAFGLPLLPVAAQQCISCHTTAAVTGGKLRVETMIRGVTCEACHGPGAQHVARMERRSPGERPAAGTLPGGTKETHKLIFNPATLDPVSLEDFCAACHRSSRLVVAEGLHGLDSIHYEPYRLEMSQCWIMTRRITCITCHDPHQPLQRDPSAYDSACLSCHAGGNASVRAGPRMREASATHSRMASRCPIANRNCVICHMPKCRLPRAPFSMSDHFIRIVGADDACAKEG